MQQTSPRDARLAALREEVREIESAGRAAGRSCLPFGLEAVDGRLAGGGLAIAALHEAAPATPALGDDAASTLFFAAVAARLAPAEGEGTVLWALVAPRPVRPRPRSGRAGARAADLRRMPPRRGGAGGDGGGAAPWRPRRGGRRGGRPEAGRRPPPPARRRGRGDDRSGAAALAQAGADPLALPSAAVTRWRIGCLPSETQRCRRWDAPAGTSRSPASAAAKRMTGYWRPPMPRLASLFLPCLPTDRIRRSEWSDKRPNLSSLRAESWGGGPHEARWRGLLSPRKPLHHPTDGEADRVPRTRSDCREQPRAHPSPSLAQGG